MGNSGNTPDDRDGRQAGDDFPSSPFMDHEPTDVSHPDRADWDDSVQNEELIPGFEIPGYTLIRELSKGGQAVIFLANQNSTGRKVAVKLLLESPLESQVERTRMEREVRVLAELDHPNIVSIIDRGVTREGLYFFVMEYLKGSILAEYMDDYHKHNPPLGLPEDFSDVLRLFTRICETVNAAHLRGIVHRDLKPSNIIIDSYGEPHIFDFGVASGAASWLLSDSSEQDPGTREFLGSLPWASPEQAEGDLSKIDTRTDVYSLGIILYEMLTGDFPYEVFSKPAETLHNIRNAIPTAPSKIFAQKIATLTAASKKKLRNPIDPTLEAMILKALEKRRDKRYQTAGAFAQDISRYLGGQPVSATGKAVATKLGPIQPVILLAGLALLLASVVILIVALSGRMSTRPHNAGETKVETKATTKTSSYTIQGSKVLFEFRPSQMDVVRLADGSLGQMSDVPSIKSVHIAGGFNTWDPGLADWKLQRVANDHYTLTRDLSDFSGRSYWSFKFVVNGNVWISAPHQEEQRVIVPEDSATYNFLLINPKAIAESADRMTAMCRKQIEEAWPGVGANLAGEAGRYFLSLTHLPENLHITSLDPIAGIPLAHLDMADVTVTDLSPLKTMTSLEKLIVNNAVYEELSADLVRNLNRGDFDSAREALASTTRAYLQVPVFHAYNEIASESIDVLEEVKKSPGAPPSLGRVFNGHTYALIILPLNWKEAFAFSRKHGAHLASITTDEEQDWILKQYGNAMLGRSFWLGGSDQRMEGVWEWTTGEVWAFRKWKVAEPNNRDGVEHALAIQQDGWWFDADGEATRIPFVMEWETAP